MSRYEALEKIVGDDAAMWVLHGMATDQAANELKKKGAVPPPPPQPPTSHVRKAPAPRKPAHREARLTLLSHRICLKSICHMWSIPSVCRTRL